MQNKAKVKYAKINVNSFVTSKYMQVGQLVIQTNKAKTKPIQTQTKPILGQYQGCQSQNKPNQSQFANSLTKNEAKNAATAQKNSTVI
jgi:hypothetical protein